MVKVHGHRELPVSHGFLHRTLATLLKTYILGATSSRDNQFIAIVPDIAPSDAFGLRFRTLGALGWAVGYQKDAEKTPSDVSIVGKL